MPKQTPSGHTGASSAISLHNQLTPRPVHICAPIMGHPVQDTLILTERSVAAEPSP